MVESYQLGLTPNPDVMCNSAIKFGCFREYALDQLGADAMATGHYAQNGLGNFLEHANWGKPRLLTAVDEKKDQTLFLSRISGDALRKTMFPVGSLTKNQVKDIGKSIGLDWVCEKRSSRGICFVGKREFDDFIDSFVEPKRGRFIHAKTGEVLGEHCGAHYFTIGQRSRLSYSNKALFVIHKDMKTHDIYVAPGTHNLMLYSDSFTCKNHHFITEKDAASSPWDETSWQGHFRFQHQMPLLGCSVDRYSMFGHDLVSRVKLVRPRRALTPGQFAVFYDGNICLGNAVIDRIGPSMHDQHRSIRLESEMLGKPGVHVEAYAV